MVRHGALEIDGAGLATSVIRFARLLRRAGLAIDPEQTRTFLHGLGLIGLASKQEVKAAGRAIYARRREDLAVFDEAFEQFWRRRADPDAVTAQLPRIRQSQSRPGMPALATDLDHALAEPAVLPIQASASVTEVLRQADFGQLSGAEARDAAKLIAAIRPRLPRRPSRRGIVARRGRRAALRRMLRLSLRTGGQPLIWHWILPTTRPRPIVLVCDISGSMERYSRFLLRFAHALAGAGAPLEVFVFGTRLTRITRQLKVHTAEEALRRVAHSVVDWSGGTRIGESLRQLNRRWVRRSIRSGAVVLLVSDGWERGDPAVLSTELARLRRSCHRLLWLDPLAGQSGFEPETVGLRAALPHIDELLPCGTVASLEQLGQLLVTGERRGRWSVKSEK